MMPRGLRGMGIALLGIVIGAGNAGTAVEPQERRIPDLAEVASVLIRESNELRRKEGRAAVSTNPRLTATAQAFAAFMAQTNKYGHEADGTTPADRVRQQGYESCVIAENIAYQLRTGGFTTPQLGAGFFEGWRDSPEHRKNILDPDVTETGVAVAHSASSDRYYAVQLFGRPRSESIAFQIRNETEDTITYKIEDRSIPLPPRSVARHDECRPPVLVFPWPDGDQPETRVRPRRGDLLRISRRGGTFQIRSAPAPLRPPPPSRSAPHPPAS